MELCKYKQSAPLEEHNHYLLQLFIEVAGALRVVLTVLANLAASAVAAGAHQGQRLLQQSLHCSCFPDQFRPHGQQLF